MWDLCALNLFQEKQKLDLYELNVYMRERKNISESAFSCWGLNEL